MICETDTTNNVETADVEELRLRYCRLRRAAERAVESAEMTIGTLKLIEAASQAGADLLDGIYHDGGSR